METQIVEWKEKDGGKILVLGGRLTIQDAVRMRELLIEAASSGSDVSIDLSGGESLDVACAQVLASAAKSLEGRGRKLCVTGDPSEGVARCLSDMAIDPFHTSGTGGEGNGQTNPERG
ncbi:MAG TPA: STAS domain-containing protein [Deltaproteobacteria bacterium]|nr:STAS domain-containing protein [Deltaproteobacteria bacterium]HOM28711.1 STAS domain-containing protein [Deltaproteobacteria bacterium]HPP81517.1 STAS domain-containing protein [Deltaproteobacteria bacterium]